MTSTRAGDCTEFAVLLTAVARAKNVPSRAVLGTVLISSSTGTQAFGHAWSELYIDGRWEIADAAIRPADGLIYHYLPIGMITNEGMGFAMGMFETVVAIPSEVRLTP
ncbi:MAG: transglutaminase family protein [Gammaproteobacteria bacterium]